MADLNEEELQALYCWIDEIPLSRQKKNITRDFSDGVLTAEIVHHFLPHLVELHNYSPANSSTQKMENWRTLNRKVFSKLNFTLPDDIIQSASASKPGVVEFILTNLRTKIERYLQNKAKAKELQLESAYDYDPNELATSETNTHAHFGQFDQMRHVGPAQLQGGFQQPVREAGYNQSRLPTEFDSVQLEYESHDNQLRADLPHPQSHFHSKLHPPRLYHHNTQHPSSTLPPIHIHSNIRGDGGILQGKAHQSLSKPPSQLPTIMHTKAKTYGGRSNRIGPPPSTFVPTVAMVGRKRIDSAQNKIRLAEKEQKLYETQEYIQLLQMKVTRLEHLVQIKDMKINELQRQLAFTTSRHPLHKQ